MLKIHLYSSPAHFPLAFARHFWFVIDEWKKKNRYEVLFYPNKDKKLGYIHVDEFTHNVWLGIFPFIKYAWKWTLKETFTGKTAKTLKKVIEDSIRGYQMAHNYKLTWPNSNTYVQWILNESNVNYILPRNAFGKNYETVCEPTE